MNAASNDSQVSARINSIRRNAGNPGTQCPSCGRAADAPARRVVKGEIVEGCVAAFHHGHLPAGSDTAAWHNRPAGRQVRAETLAFLLAV